MKGEATVRMICIMAGSVLAAVLVPLAVRARVAAPRPVEAPPLAYSFWEGRFKVSTNGQTQGMHLNPALAARGEYVYAMWSKQGSGAADYDPNYNWSDSYGSPWDGWDNTDANIDDNALDTVNVDLAVDSANRLHFVWAEATSTPKYTLYYSCTQAASIQTIATTNESGMVPAIAVGSSDVHVVWSEGSSDIKYSSKPLASGSWSAPYTVRSSPVDPLANPAIAVEGSTVHVAWNEGAPGEILYKKKNGSWSTVKTVSWDVTLGSYVPALAVSGSDVYAVWCEFQGTPTQTIRFGQSGDGGSNWGSSTQIPGGPLAANDQIPYYLRPDIAVDISGTLHVVFNGSTTMGGFEDVFYVSKDGSGWTDRKDISEKAQPIGALAYNANSTTPAIAVSGSCVHVIWAEQWVDDPNDQYEVIYRRRVSMELGEGVFLPIILKSW